MAALRAVAAVFALSMFGSRLAVYASKVGCSADSESDACPVSASAGDTMLTKRQDVKTQAPEEEEAVPHDDVQQTSGATEKAAVVGAAADSKKATAMAEVVAGKAVTTGECRHAKITVHNADLSGDSTLYPYVKVNYGSEQNKDLTFETMHKMGPPYPVVWDHTQEVVLCNEARPLHFEVWHKGYLSDNLLAEANLDSSQFGDGGYRGNLKFEDQVKGQMHVSILF